MVTFRKMDADCLEQYDSVPMLVHITSEYKLIKRNRGLGGIAFEEVPIRPHVKDFRLYGSAAEDAKRFDTSNWAYFMAFDGERPIGAATVVTRTKEINMLGGRDDLAVLWDIRVDDTHKRRGVGQGLFDMAKNWAKDVGMTQLKIECQNNNVAACHFYHKQGAVLGAVDTYAYFNEPDCREEAQLIWYLDL